MFSDPDDPIVPFLARLKTGDELDLLTMGVGLVVPQGQEIEVETQKVFFVSRSIKTAGKSRIMFQGPSVLSNSNFLLSQTRNGYPSKSHLKNCLNRYLISERPTFQAISGDIQYLNGVHRFFGSTKLTKNQ